jgi:orotate phosphoribosyltransferase
LPKDGLLCRLKGAGANVIGAACIVDRSNGKADVGGLKFVSLAAVDFPDYDGKMEDLRLAMQEHGVSHALCVSVNLPDWPRVMALAV